MSIIVNNNELSQEQAKPIIDNNKISLIIAGAGSGKTFTIVGKIKYMLDKKLINPNEICAITYTNKAVESLSNKIYKEINKKIDVYTFHKLALKIIDIKQIDYNIDNELLKDTINDFFINKAYNNKTLLNYIYNYFNVYIFKTSKKYQKILKSQEYLNLINLILQIINYIKCNHNINDYYKIIKDNYRYKRLLLIVYTIHIIYIKRLKDNNLLDFDEMIILATRLIKNNDVILPYKLIIIDEFQDTSKVRFDLIRAIVKQSNSSLFCVGDDYQSIYRFQGCDLSIFLNFTKIYNETKTYYLNETYRNSKELVDTAGQFIKKNKYQIDKVLESKKTLYKPIIIIKYSAEKEVLKNLLKTLPLDKEITILARNNFDIKKYLKEYQIRNNNLIIDNDKHNLKYMTIHASKGLESDIIIIINVVNDKYGIPSKLKDNKIIERIKGKEEYKYAEERRLFYVGLTRTKSYVYLLTNKNNPSIFIKEIEKSNNVKTLLLK